MGLDLALGGLVLMAAIRGWLKGFVLQAIRLGGLVACVYAADPVRDAAKPRVIGYLPTIRPELVDRLLWWSSAALSYVVLVGLATLIVKLYRRKPFGMEERNRSDQVAGSILGGLKGVVVAAGLLVSIEHYALGHLKDLPWAEGQVNESNAVYWNARYRPVTRVWASPPVRHFVNHVRRMGLASPSDAAADEPSPVQTASSGAPRLELNASERPALDRSTLDPDVAAAVDAIKAELQKAETDK